MFPKVFLELILHAPKFSFASLTNSPLNRPCWSTSLVPLMTSSIFKDPGDTSSSTLLKGRGPLNNARVHQDEKLFPVLLSDPSILKTLPKTFPKEMKPKWGKKREEGGEKRRERAKRMPWCFAHARTTEADILCVEEKAAKCSTYKRRSGYFWLFIFSRRIRFPCLHSLI